MLNTDWAGCVSLAAWKEIKPRLHRAIQLIVLTEEAKNAENWTLLFRNNKESTNSTMILTSANYDA